MDGFVGRVIAFVVCDAEPGMQPGWIERRLCMIETVTGDLKLGHLWW